MLKYIMDITHLPEHIFIDIARNLSPKDLFSCSLVNTTWRNAVNCNDIWRYICKNTKVSDSGEELDHIPSIVSGCDNLPYSARDFEPLCKWRITFMRWEKLKYNWLYGRFKRFNISEPVPMLSGIECDDNVALVVRNDIRELSVWNIRHVPYHQENIKFCLTHVCSEFVKLQDDFLVIVQCNLLQVFRSSEDGFHLHFRSIFDKPESYSKKLPVDHDITDWYRSNINLYPCDLVLRCEHNGTKFIGSILDGDRKCVVLHIWDLNKKIKDTEVQIPSLYAVSDINFSVSNHYLFMLMRNLTPDISFYSLQAYDLKDLAFVEYNIRSGCEIPAYSVYDDTVVAVDYIQRCVNVWKFKSKSHKMLKCDFQIDVKCFNVEQSHLLIGGRCVIDNDRIIRVYHLDNFECIFFTTVSYTVGFVSLIHNRFLIIGATSDYHFLSVVDTSKDCVLYYLANDDCVFVNSTHSKLLTRVESELNVITFW